MPNNTSLTELRGDAPAQLPTLGTPRAVVNGYETSSTQVAALKQLELAKDATTIIDLV